MNRSSPRAVPGDVAAGPPGAILPVPNALFDRAVEVSESRFEVLCMDHDLEWVQQQLVPGWNAEQVAAYPGRLDPPATLRHDTPARCPTSDVEVPNTAIAASIPIVVSG